VLVDTVFSPVARATCACFASASALMPAARKVEGDLFGSTGACLALDAALKFG
jgi:hypothetical chaperone protein